MFYLAAQHLFPFSCCYVHLPFVLLFGPFIQLLCFLQCLQFFIDAWFFALFHKFTWHCSFCGFHFYCGIILLDNCLLLFIWSSCQKLIFRLIVRAVHFVSLTFLSFLSCFISWFFHLLYALCFMSCTRIHSLSVGPDSASCALALTRPAGVSWLAIAGIYFSFLFYLFILINHCPHLSIPFSVDIIQ